MGSDQCTFKIRTLLKTSKPNNHLRNITLKAYPNDEALCVISCIKEYIKRTQVLRGECTKLLISFVKPPGTVSTGTISRWLKTSLGLCGIDRAAFKACNFRAAPASTAKQAEVPIEKFWNSKLD